MDTRTVPLVEAASNTDVSATLHLRLRAQQVVAVEAVWKPLREALGDLIEHGHWDWTLKTPLLDDPAVRFVGIEYAADMQGMMAVFESGYDSRLPLTRGDPLVYVEYVESAPWNLRLPGQTQRYRGVGSRLLEHAVARSIELGYGGRLGLVALPQAESFYERTCGMTDLGPDPRYNGLVYYELSADHAQHLQRRG